MRITRTRAAIATGSVALLALVGCTAPVEDEATTSITIGWTPPDITGVFQTATDYFEQAAEGAAEAGIDVRSSPVRPRPTSVRRPARDRRGLRYTRSRRHRDLACRY